jgi:predicted RNA-binding protein Jag
MRFLKYYFRSGGKDEPEELALREAEAAIAEAKRTAKSVDLTPQNSYLRRLQHQLVEKSGLRSESVGEEPRRRLRIYAPE